MKSGVVAKLVDALDLGSSGAIRESSSLSDPTTIYKKSVIMADFLFILNQIIKQTVIKI